jgi:hypothetical protein
MVRAFAAALAAATSALLIALPATGAQPRRAPTLKLASLAPLSVTGRSFGPREGVLLILRGEGGLTRVATTRAARNGRFRASFRIRLNRCDSFTIRAAGTAGSRAVLQVERDCGDEQRGPRERAPREKRKPGRG